MVEMKNDNDFNHLIDSISLINKRCDELNDCKLAIKQMNDTIRNDLYKNMDQIVASLKQKLDEFCDVLKNRLKISHNSLGEKKTNLSLKINGLIDELNQKKAEISSDDIEKSAKLKQLLALSFKKKQEIEQEISGYKIDDLFPNFHFSVTTLQLEEAIRALKLEINDNPNINKFNKIVKIAAYAALDTVVTSGLDDNGCFFLQLSTSENQAENIIDEINRYIRFKRITDTKWFTFQEEKKYPEENEKCFCLHKKSQKWMRAIVEEINKNKTACKIHYLDVNQSDSEVPLENLMKWRDLGRLNNIDFQSIKCCLFIKANEKKISCNTKFLFKDLTAKKKFKCVFKQLIDNSCTWIVELYNTVDYETEKLQTIFPVNKFIIDDYNESLGTKKSKICSDIRLQDKNSQVKVNYNVVCYSDNDLKKLTDNNIAKSATITEINSNSNLKSTKSDLEVISEILLDIISSIETEKPIHVIENEAESEAENAVKNKAEKVDTLYDTSDQEDIDLEERAYKGRTGSCLISSEISKNGIFWIAQKQKSLKSFDYISSIITNYIQETKQKSFYHLNKTPVPDMKCFVELWVKNKKDNKEFRRAVIESLDAERLIARVCLLDKASQISVPLKQIYPYAKIFKMGFKAIRCAISSDFVVDENKIRMFNQFKQNYLIKFLLTEKIIINNLECWKAELQSSDYRYFILKLVL